MAWTSVHTFAVGDVLGAADLNTWLTNNTQFLFQPPSCRAHKSTGLVCSTSVFTLVSMDVEDWKNTDAAMHSTASNQSRMIAVTAGVYVVTGYAVFNGSLTATSYGDLTLNAAGTHAGSTILSYDSRDYTRVSTSPVMNPPLTHKLAVNDYIEFFVWHNQGANQTAVSPRSTTTGPELTMAWISN